MTPAEFRNALNRLGLTQVGAARLFRVAPKTVRNWACSGCHGTIVTLLRLMLDGTITVQDVERARG